ncbi:hypothetical protein RJ639_018977 [Escallonia herrerae]|uniref:Alcohol dehydrogenase n=1 Tax=Escallonia herrerae TaxID=1293975 RepID=A0AA88VAF1_9ASTE|nr:hypothetical protein RJ639_018977 [Escallonia herrerae]
MEEVQVSPPQPMEIRLKVVCTSLCRSDITSWLAQAQPPIFPRIFGHEASGIVESVGQGVTEFEEGDHVLTLFIGECKRCRHCTSGKSNICQVLGLERRGVMHSDQETRFSVKGKPIYHYCAVSSFSEYTVVHSGCAVKVSSIAPLEKVCLLSCGVAAGNVFDVHGIFHIKGFPTFFINLRDPWVMPSLEWLDLLLLDGSKKREISGLLRCEESLCSASLLQILSGLGAAWKVADVSEGSTVVIFGLGTVGLSVAQGAKMRGASRIIGVDTNPEKSEKAKAFGITDFINPNDCNEPIQQVIKNITDGGADYSFECVGDTGMITTALQSCCDGWGLAVTLGVPNTKPEIAAHYGLFLSGRTLRGSLFGGWKPKSDLPQLVDMYLREELHIDEFITHNLPFEEINKAFDLMTAGKCLRCVIHMPS